jgi:hypothetical protein
LYGCDAVSKRTVFVFSDVVQRGELRDLRVCDDPERHIIQNDDRRIDSEGTC